MRVFRNKNNKKVEKNSAEIKIEKPTESLEKNNETKDVVKIDLVDSSINDFTEKTQELKKQEEKPRTVKKRTAKVPCRVLFAKPSYFVIEKNGEKITVNKKNNYCRGEEILY